MNRRIATVVAIVALTLGTGMGSSASATGKDSFSFHASEISGFPGGRSIELTGGGAYHFPDFIHAGGGFGCTSPISQWQRKRRITAGP